MKKKTTRPRKATVGSAKGYDFGTPVHFLQVGDTEWMTTISDAQIVGCSYGYYPVAELGTNIPALSLIARDKDRVVSAFKTFDSWTAGSDDDALEATIVFLRSGAYLLGISPEPDRMAARMPLAPIVDRMAILQTWVKRMDTTHEGLRELQRFHKGLIAPIALHASWLPQVFPNPSITNLKFIPEVRPFIKFRFSFVDEDDEVMPPTADIMLQLHRGRLKKGSVGNMHPGPPKVSARMWTQKREAVLREMFPLTLFRARVSGLMDASRGKFVPGKVADWQIGQAICNIVLSREISKDAYHYEGVHPENLTGTVIDTARAHTEIADGEEKLKDITPDHVEGQMRLDADYLVAHLKEIPRDGSLSARQAILKRRGYLERN